MKPVTDEQAINELLARGVSEIVVEKDLREKLLSGKTLRIKFGIDPTSPHLHLGRAVPLLKLRDFQALGHQVVFILGDFTGTIGDTSDKDSERPMLTREEVDRNMETYVAQVAKIIDVDKCEIRHNSEWLAKLDYNEIGKQADAFSVSDFISRDNIKTRLDAGKRVSLREVLYPLMQGYDSVAVEADIEIGGTDQRFNLLAGRTLQTNYRQPPQNILMGPLLEGTDGRKMSSSWGNTIALTLEAADMYGKVMSIKDDLIIKYFTVATRLPLSEIEQYSKALEAGENPRDYKMKLAKMIVTMYHSEDAAAMAEQSFIDAFQKGGVPADIPEIKVEAGELLVDVLLKQELIKSKAEYRRLITEGAVEDMEKSEKVADPVFKISAPITLRIGKSRFLKIII
jgi:tyrosyl-tRNA synthetase